MITRKDLHIKLLQELESNGISYPYNVSNFMEMNFKNPFHKRNDVEVWDIEIAKQSTSLLKELLNRNYIDFHPLLLNDFEKSSKNMWFHNTEFNIKLTISGIDYLNNYKLIQSNMSVNKASKISYRSILILGILTLLATLCSVYNSWTANKISDQKKHDEEHHKPLRKQK